MSDRVIAKFSGGMSFRHIKLSAKSVSGRGVIAKLDETERYIAKFSVRMSARYTRLSTTLDGSKQKQFKRA